jgi:hypothetical protein
VRALAALGSNSPLIRPQICAFRPSCARFVPTQARFVTLRGRSVDIWGTVLHKYPSNRRTAPAWRGACLF